MPTHKISAKKKIIPVCVLARGNPFIEKTIRSIYAQKLPKCYEILIIAGVNGLASDDDPTASIIKKSFPKVVLLTDQKSGKVQSWNQVMDWLREKGFKHTVFLDSDIEFPKDNVVWEMHKAMEDDEKRLAVAGTVRAKKEAITAQCRKKLLRG